MLKKWSVLPNNQPDLVKELQNSIHVNETIAKILVNRGITDFDSAKQFFRPDLKSIYSPFSMKDMDKATQRIATAIANSENILVYGDYDVDGTTSVALVYSYLATYYDSLSYYVPDRYGEGYGISFKAIDFAVDNDISLVIALDCGIKAVDKIEYANKNKIDFIICDHHLPGTKIPEATAILNPKQSDCPYPYKELSGCGIGFKLIQALHHNRGLEFNDLLPYLDLVAISIACDIVPITDENRILAFHGLQQLHLNKRKGVQILLEQAKFKNKLTITDLVFVIGPRINAAGRIHHASKAIEMLISDNENWAKEINQEINDFNTERKALDKLITQEALAMISEKDKLQKAKTTVVFQENWHKGVVGIVASRLIETYYRPTIVLTESKGMVTGSARSVIGFNVHQAIEKCADLLDQFGGHKYAAGLSLKKENLPNFCKKFEQAVASTILPEMLTPEIKVDAELQLSEINNRFFNILNQMEPFGPENRHPVFISKNVVDSGFSKVVGDDKTHLKLSIKQNSVSLNGIAFGMGHHLEKIKTKEPFHIVYSINENIWNGTTTLQLMVKDIKFDE